MIYSTVHLRLPGNLSQNDRLLGQLEAFTDPRFLLTGHTAKLVVSGTWYIVYEDLESSLGHQYVVSPAVRMFNSLLTVCIGKMPNLRSFVWDAQIAPTQRLLSALALREELQYLQLRIATNDTPDPYFHPLLSFETFLKLVSLNIVQVDKAEILYSIGHVLASARHLSELRVWADVDAGLAVASLFAFPSRARKLRLTVLDLRGFISLNVEPSLWDYVESACLLELGLEVGANFNHDRHTQFWSSAVTASVTVERLSTNAITTNLASFLESFSGLRTVILLPNGGPDPIEPLPAILTALAYKHSDTLRVLALHPPSQDNPQYSLSSRTLGTIVRTFPDLTEFAFVVQADDLSNLTPMFSLPNLETLHVSLSSHSSSSSGKINDPECLNLRSYLSAALLNGAGQKLRYIAIEAGPIYLVERNPLRWQVLTRHLGRVRDTELFCDRFIDWLDDVVKLR